MDRADLELVVAVTQQGSMAAAARSLRVAPSAVTKRLAALEARLGLRLFLRTTRRVSPTAEGQTLHAHALTLLRGFQDAEADLRERLSEPTGQIRLAATFGFGRLWLGPALAEFQSRYPRLQIRVQLLEQLPDLAVEGYDGAIWLWNAPGHRAGEWVSRRLARNQRVLVATPAYLKAHGTPASVDDLAHHACLLVGENGNDPAQPLDTWVLQKDRERRVHRVAVRGPLQSNSGELVRDWCLAGCGIMLRSLWDIAPQLASGTLVRVLPHYQMADADIHWLAPYRPRSPRGVKLLVDHLARQFGQEPWKAEVKPSGRCAPPG
jgi:DNA-binding transcriptional LysR family regulator